MEDKDTRKNLVPVEVHYSESDNVWTFNPQEAGFSKLSFKADEQRMRRLLRRMKAKDSLTYPNSRKGTTYQNMLDDIASSGVSSIFVWRSHCPTSIDLIKAMMEK
jgi:hypothetical protein